MTGYLKSVGSLIWSVEAFQLSTARKGMVRLAERDRCGAGHHRKLLNLGLVRARTPGFQNCRQRFPLVAI